MEASTQDGQGWLQLHKALESFNTQPDVIEVLARFCDVNILAAPLHLSILEDEYNLHHGHTGGTPLMMACRESLGYCRKPHRIQWRAAQVRALLAAPVLL